MAVESWSEYVKRIAAGMNQLQIAEKTGLAQTNIGRWLRGDPGIPRAESAIQFARGFNRPPVEALVAAGYLNKDEAAATIEIRIPLSEFSNQEVLDDVNRRMLEG